MDIADKTFLIDAETRVINIPDGEEHLGVEGDVGTGHKYFKCPRIVGDDGIDLNDHQIYISYVKTNTAKATRFVGDPALYHCNDVALDETGDYVTFSWEMSGDVFKTQGLIAFKVMAKKTDSESVKTCWNTRPAIGTVCMTVPDGIEGIAELYPDIITQLLDRMDAVEEIATVEAMQGYVDDYLGRNPVQLDSTLTDPEKAAPADVVGELRGDIGDIITVFQSNNLLNPRNIVKGHYYGYDGNGKIVPIENSKYDCALVEVVNGVTKYSANGISYNAYNITKDMEYLGISCKAAQSIYNPIFDTTVIAGGTPSKPVKYITLSWSNITFDSSKMICVKGETVPSKYEEFFKTVSLNENVQVDYKQMKNAPKVAKKYIVSLDGTGDFTSLTECLKTLKNDSSEKIIYVNSGIYNIYEEIGGDDFVNSIPENAESYFDYITVVPPNTSIIGIGFARLEYLPLNDIPRIAQQFISPLNISDGNVRIENIEIVCKKCRYAIHDQTLNDGNWYHIYKNVHCEKDDVTSTYNGKAQAFGCGFTNGVKFEFDACYFKSHHLPFSFHNATNAYGTILIKNCVSKAFNTSWKDYASLRFGNVSSVQTHIPVIVSNTYLENGVSTQNESGEKPNAFDVKIIGCYGNTTVTNKCATNIYEAETFN